MPGLASEVKSSERRSAHSSSVHHASEPGGFWVPRVALVAPNVPYRNERGTPVNHGLCLEEKGICFLVSRPGGFRSGLPALVFPLFT